MHAGYGYSRLFSFLILGIILAIIFLYNNNDKFRSFCDGFRMSQNGVVRNIAVVLSVSMLIWPYWIAQYGFDWMDTFFHLNMFRSYPERCNVAHFGSTIIGYGLYRMTSGNVVYMQWVTVLLMQLSMLLPVLTMKTVTDNRINIKDVLTFSSISALILHFNTLILCYDTISYLALSAICSLLIFQNYKPHWKCTVLLGMVCGVYISLRLPNLVMTIFAPCIILLQGILRKKFIKGIINAFVVVAISVAVYYGLICAEYGSFSSITNQMASTMAGNEDHSIGGMIRAYIIQSFNLFLYTAILILSYFAFNSNSKKKKIIALLTAVFMILFTCMYYRCVDHEYENVRLLINAATLSLCVYFAIVKKEYVLVASILSCYVLPILGSNTGILKLCSIVCLPLLAYMFTRDRKNYRYMVLIVMAMVIYMPIRLFSYTIFDDGIYMLNQRCENEPTVSGLYTSLYRKSSVVDAQNIIKKEIAEGKEIVCIGSHRHPFTYMNDLKDPFTVCHQNPDAENIVEKFIEYYEKHPNTYFVLFRDGRPKSPTLLETTFANNNIPYHTTYLNVDGNWR